MSGAKSARKEEQERIRKTNRMLISMVVIFGISWLPLNTYNLVQDFYIPAARWKFARAFFLLGEC
jgi:neuropeptide Y receptor